MSDDKDDADHGGDIRDYIDTHGHWLDYKIEQEFSSSKPPARLVRFMPLEQYLSILTTRQLYIPRATEYDDPYDCAFPGSLSDAIREALVESCNEPEFALPGELDHSHFVQKAEDILASQLDDRFSGEVPDRWFVSCWHAGEALTDLMWRSYGGHKGVCVSCDGPALLKQLQDTIWVKRNFLAAEDRGLENFEFLYGYVDYERPVFEVEPDEEAGPTVTVRHPAFHVPIGLPTSGSRSCDVRARKLLGRPRGSSMFPAPVRACLRDGDYSSLSSLHRAIDGPGLTKQALCLLPKIRHVDDLLVRVPAFSECIREVHPEVSFALWNDDRPMRFKKAKSEGQQERQRLIDREWPGERERLMRELRGGRFAKDDLNAACAALWSARRIAAGQARQLPNEVERDSKGLRMRIEA